VRNLFEHMLKTAMTEKEEQVKVQSALLFNMNNLGGKNNFMEYQIDLHHLSFPEAKIKLMEYLMQIRNDLINHKIQCNSPYRNAHIVKLVAGAGNHREKGVTCGLKEKFVKYLK
jgi:hypothetical protein